MDKLELDARVARVERRLSLLTALAITGLLAIGLNFGAIALRRDALAQALPPPLAPRPIPPSPPPTPASPDSTVIAGGGMPGPVYDNPFGLGGMGMPAPLGQSLEQLMTVRQLLQEKTITAEDWEAKKAQILSKPIVAANLRNDLQAVQMLWENKALTDAERDAFKRHLLGLAKPGEAPSHAADEAVKAVDK
jgi:hypothetical protein